ncbi:MAG: PadR family transcriptional regulator [Bacteroidetes bacterium CG12_big_fil_rev_8_21_14_0_65_60_17]|nr:MAG: PadR family transcriptional regulator [Bacteroidetes bacterium CG12_big_fil_rev_8_21_14_0_65_60_17]
MITRSLATATLRPMVLALLDGRPEYGYQIIARIRKLSGGEIDWTTGTLYPFLHGLENEGLVESFWQAAESAPRRKYYRLTPAGERALEAERTQWQQVHAMLAPLFAGGR